MRAFGVARDFRAAHGEDAFRLLATTAFSDADVDHSGTISLGELRTTLAQLSIKLTDEQSDLVFKRYDSDASGQIDEKEWLSLVSDLIDGSITGASATAATADSSGESSEVSALRAEVRGLRERVAQLESQMATLMRAGLLPEQKRASQSGASPGGGRPQTAGPAVSTMVSVSNAEPRQESRRSCLHCGHAWLDKCNVHAQTHGKEHGDTARA